MNTQRLVILILAALVLGGCNKSTIPDPDAQGDYVDGDSMADTDGFGNDGLTEGEEIYDPFADELTTVIYFDFDQSQLRAEYADLLQRHASRLANDRRAQVRLEGHADERGSREYNIGLGERRSQAVRQLLLVQGASADQISTVSFGEERPAAFGSDEEAYQLNRRVEIKYQN